ncbi:insulin-like growth factor-binding protein complex acid labile subunit [Branchiostoma lanceolatum]|uniref:insulin-like growth factor-binding protein complex acid labile subunit n=1 Tax=Branchiostoma lanceolatum TaxID=7740 RepID=UPI003453BAB8
MTPTMRLPCVLLVIMSVAVCMFLGSSACPMYCTCDNVEKYEIAVYCRGPEISAIPRDIPKNTTLLEISFTELAVLRMGDFVDMPKLTQLNVWSNFNLSAVEFGTFDNLPTITDLRLSNNSFTKLPTGLFGSLKNLTTFDGRNNKLEMIQHGLFTDHPSLQIIRLDFGNITVLEEGAFGGLPNLTSVYVGSNRLTSLTSSAFKGSAQLKSLYISDNSIADIGKDAFTDTSFESLYLTRNAITAVDVNAFSPLRNLQRIYLDYNNIENLEGVFKGLPQLLSISLAYNKLTSLEGVFTNLPKLSSLSVNRNRISKISNSTFDGVPRLGSLSIASNNIYEVESGAFRNLDSLVALYMDSNQITEISLAGLQSLTSLSINSNNLHSFPTDLNDAYQLEVLYMSSNPIEETLEEQFSALHRLSTLYLSNITCLKGTLNSNALRGLNALKEVWLSFNELSTLPTTTFQSTTHITTIWLQNNSLVELSDGLLHGLTDLNQLDLSYNRLSHLNPDTFLGLDKLRILILTGNNFTNMAHVSPALAILPSQVALNLKDNPFVHLDRASFPMPMNHANVLSMSRSHIRVIEEGTFLDVTFSNLTRLELDQTDFLHFLPGNMLEGLDNLTAMIAYDDPFHCDCQLKAFVTWLRERVNPPYVSATCASPPSLKGKDLTDVPLASLTCDCQQVEAPSIDTSGSDNSTREGQTAMLNCKISGCPEAEFFWTTPTGAMLAVESGFPRMEVLGSGTLVVTEAREEDTGVYTCTAVNYRGKTSKEVALHVDNKH